MPVGIETYNSSGKILFSSDVMTWALRRTGSGTSIVATAGNTLASMIKIPIDITTYSRPMFGFQCNSLVGFLGPEVGTNFPRFACSGGVGTAYNWFMFDWTADIPDLGYGFETYNAAGQRTYSSAQRALQALDVITSGFVTYTGKSLCVVVPCWSGHEIWDNFGECLDTEPSESWEPGMPCTNLQLNQDSKIYGGNTFDSNQSAAIGEISFDDVTLNTSSSAYAAHSNFTVTMPFLIADVTGVAIGSIFY